MREYMVVFYSDLYVHSLYEVQIDDQNPKNIYF